MAINKIRWLAVFLSFIFAAILELNLLPETLAFLRPEWLVLTLIYWLLRHPERIGVVTGVVIGLIMDVLSGSYFGIHMLSLSLICYLVLIMHKRLKMFPLVQQSVVVFFLVSIQLMIIYTLRSILGASDLGLAYLWQALSSAVLWPVIVILYDRLAFALR
ncbi:MAG: rod shape-determining protein MreD [Pseudohongiellaceae bacterium]